MGVYDWIRDAVRQAVLMGFSDAIEQVGVPEQGGKMNEALASMLKVSPARAIEQAKPTASISAGPQSGNRKRLGRTLEIARKSAEDIE